MPVSRDIDFRQGFRPKKIRLAVTKEKLIGDSGLGTIVDLFDSSPLAKEFAKCLPQRLSNRSLGSYRLGLILLASLASDHECLDDLIKFEDDPSLEEYFQGEIPVPKTIGWEKQIEGDESWTPWEYDLETKVKYAKKDKTPPEIYLKRWYWEPGWAKDKLMFPVIIKKEWKADKYFEDSGSWHYHAVVTNMDLSKNSFQSVIEAYRKRANIENHIKEYKINFDAKHLPCLKFNANHAYMLFVLIAHNLLRWVALLDSPDKPLYAKKLRRKFIFHPGKLVKHARTLTLKVSEKFKQEVDKLTEAWGSQPVTVPLTYSSA